MNYSLSPLKCLFYPWEKGLLELPGADSRTLFLNAKEAEELSAVSGEFFCQQHFKPEYDRLKAAGRKVTPQAISDGEGFECILLLAPKQMQEMKYFIASGINRLNEAGMIICAAANDAGGGRIGKLFEELGLKASSESKFKAKVVWAEVQSKAINRKVLSEYLACGSLRQAVHGMYSSPGLFGWEKVDKGSAMLAGGLPEDLFGKGADFGCGYGYISLKLLEKNPGVGKLMCIDADYRALDACRANLKGYRSLAEFYWENLASSYPPVTGLDFVVMNPPFHEEKQTAIEIGQAFIRTASLSLKRGGRLWMVANSHLPYEKVLGGLFRCTEISEERNGFKIFAAVK